MNSDNRNWREVGDAPDYRFSLANERTFLAWIRTALALLAGAIGIDQLTPELASPDVRMYISVFLCSCSGMLSIFAYRRWADNERSIRNNEELKYTFFLKTISIFILIITFIVMMVISR